MLFLFTVFLSLHVSTAQETGDLRLVDGDAPYEGRLEIYVRGSGWGTICVGGYSYGNDRGFDFLEADTACRQLGYSRAAEVGRVGDLDVPSGQGNTLLGEVKCPLDATHLYNNCTYSTSCRYSYRSTDVAISCRDVNSTPKPYDVRLVDSRGNTNGSAGRLEMYFDGNWFTFCRADIYALNIACWNTVRGIYHSYGTVEKLGYSPGSGDTYIMTCSRNYAELEYCSRVRALECSHQDDLAVSCVVCDRADWCDGDVDCDMCVDECHCDSYQVHTVQVSCNDCVCDEMEFKCEGSGLCIREDYACDGRAHCSDASDEEIPECLEKMQQASKELDELGGRSAGIVVGVVFGVLLLLLVPLLLCLCLPPCPLRKVFSAQVSAANNGISPVSDQPR